MSDIARSNVLAPCNLASILMDDSSARPTVRGFDFNNTALTNGESSPSDNSNNVNISLDSFAASFLTTGFQATNVALAIKEINNMIKWRLSDRPITDNDYDDMRLPEVREKIKCTIFLSYTSNMISCGMRETIKYLVQHKHVHCLVTTAGGIEEDIIKCLAPTLLGDFKMKGGELRTNGINRIGNLLVPNNNYCLFEDFLMPIVNAMTDEQENGGVRWSPSSFIARLGKEINHEDSVYYWAWKNNIPVFVLLLPMEVSVICCIFIHINVQSSLWILFKI